METEDIPEQKRHFSKHSQKGGISLGKIFLKENPKKVSEKSVKNGNSKSAQKV